MRLRIHIGLGLICMLLSKSYSQNLASIGEAKPLKVTGGLNINQVFYESTGIEGRRDPYNYFISGNLNFSIYEWQVPLSFSYSDQNASFQQPFNQYGLSPTYKNITAHLGYRSMSFSKYSLAGHLFLGGGIEVEINEKLSVSMMYGRLQKAIPIDSMNSIPAYMRLGGGMKLHYGSDKDFIDFIFFKAKDDSTSLENISGQTEVKPEENLVLSVGFGISPIKGLSIKGEVAGSALTSDTRSPEVVHKSFGALFANRVSTSFYKAINADIQYQFQQYSFGMNYERVDPGYRTLGAYYFNNDLENISLIHQSSWFGSKLNLNVRFGIQKNNLENTELSSMQRLSWAGAISYSITPKIITQFNFSDFNTYVNFRPLVEVLDQSTPYDNLDTLNYHQLSRQASSNTSFILNDTKELRQSLNINFTFQETTDGRSNDSYSGTQFYNLNTAYLMSFGETGWSATLSGNFNLTKSLTDHFILGPSTSLRKRLFKDKVNTHITFSYNQSRVVGTASSRIYNFRTGGTYSMNAHQFSINLTAIDRFNPANEMNQNFTEFVAEFGYHFNFAIK